MPKDPKPLSATTRQPAPALGPRAQVTIERILDATRETFLTHGYGGTAIDDITDRAGISRASFYTYFPSKRDVLLSTGAGATKAAREAIAGLDDLPDNWTIDDLVAWLRAGFAFLDSYGSFGLAWSQAAHEDDELRAAGMNAHLRTCGILGAKLNEIRGVPLTGDTQMGLLVFSMLERVWAQQKLYDPTVDTDQVIESSAHLLAAILRP